MGCNQCFESNKQQNKEILTLKTAPKLASVEDNCFENFFDIYKVNKNQKCPLDEEVKPEITEENWQSSKRLNLSNGANDSIIRILEPFPQLHRIYSPSNTEDIVTDPNLFEDQLLMYYNKSRVSPQSIIPYLEKIIADHNSGVSNSNYIVIQRKKIFLKEGLLSIIKVINLLKMQPSLEPLTKKIELRIEIPSIDEWKNPDFISDYVSHKKNELILCGNHNLTIGFHIDITSMSPLNCFLLQMIDDNGMEGQRRRNILNEKFKCCSISAKLIDGIGSSSRKAKTNKSFAIYSLFC